MVFSGFLERQSQASKFVAFISRAKIKFLLCTRASQMGEVIEKASEIRIEESYATFHSKFDYAGAHPPTFRECVSRFTFLTK